MGCHVGCSGVVQSTQCWRKEQRLPGHAEVAGAKNSHGGVRQGTEDQLVEAGADVSILPQRERVLVFCVTEAGEQVCRTKPTHAWAGFTPSIPQKYLQKDKSGGEGEGEWVCCWFSW